MTDLARLGLYVDSTGVVRATDHMGKFAREGKRAEGIAGKFGKTGTAAFGAVAAAASGAVAAIASIGSAVQTIRQFESSMSQVSAITGATRGELEALRDVAKDLGSTTEFSASQAADGLRFLGMAGFSAAESIKAIPAVLDLATASSMGLAESADIASNVLSGFGLEAGQAAQVADVLAAASSSANTSVSQLGRAMSTVAPISAALGIDLADTASAIGVLSDAGIQGERAGTALRGVLASLAGPTTQAQQALAQYGLTAADVNPETQSLTEIFGLLEERGLTTADAMTIFGREAASGALVLADASDRVGEFGDELRGAEGAASDMAGIMRDNLAGSANSALSALQGLAIAMGEAGLTAILRGALDGITAIVRGLTRLVEAVGAAIDFVQRHTSATDSVTEAMREQAIQAGNVEVATKNVATASQGAAEAALQEARAQMAKIDAWREWRAEAVRASDEYQRLQNAVDLAAAELDMLYQLQSQNGGEFAPMTAEAAAAMDELKTQLILARAAQDELLESANYTSSEYNKLQRDVDRLEAELKQAAASGGALVDGIIPLPDIITEGGNAAAVLSANIASINFSAPIEGARRLARNLEVSLHQAMQMMGLLGATAQASRDEVVFDPRDPRYDAAAAEQAARLERISNIMGDLADSTKVVVPGLENTATAIGSAGRASSGASSAVEDLNEQIEATNPLLEGLNGAFGQMVDYMFDGFKDGLSGIWRIFTNTLKQMAAAALKNRITIGLGLSVAGGTGTAALAGGAGGGGLLSNVLGLAGGGGSFLGGVASGLGGVLSGGGLASSFANLGGMLSGSVGITGGAIGAALPAVGIVAAPFLLAAAFKKTEVVVAEGVRARIEGAMLELDSYEKTKTNNGLGFSSGFDREFTRLDEAVQSVVGARLDATTAALGSLGFGTDLSGFSFSKRTEIKDGETFEGESEEVIREALNAAIEYLTDGALEIYQQAGEDVSTTLDRMVTSFNGVNEALYLLDQSLLPVSLDGSAAASALLELSGGLDAFSSKTAFVFENFLTDQQKADRAYRELKLAISDLGLTAIPETHQAFLDLMEAQDLTTDAGREMYAGLQDIAGLFITVKGTAQDAANELANLNNSINDAGNAAQTWTTVSNASAVDEMAQITSDALTDAENALRRAFGAEADRINEAYDLQIQAAQASADAANAMARAQAAESERLRQERLSALEAQADALSDRVSIYRTIGDALERAYSDRRVLTAIGQRMQLSNAQAFLRAAVASGGTTDVDRLEQALEAVENPSTALYGSFQDYIHDFNVNTNLISELRELNDDTLTVEERSLRALEDQIDTIRSAERAQVESIQANTAAIEQARDAELGALNSQLNALLGIDDSVLSVADAIANLEFAQAQAQAAQDAVDNAVSPGASDVDSQFAVGSRLWNAQNDPNSLSAEINRQYNQILGRNVDAAGLDFYHDLITADNGFGVFEMIEDLLKNRDADVGVPAFEGGGFTGYGPRSGGLDGRGGFMAMLHPNETVIDHTRGSGRSGGGEIVAELRALQAEQRETNDRMRLLQIEVNKIGLIKRDEFANGSLYDREKDKAAAEAQA